MGEIERYHRTLEERCRYVLAGMRLIGSDAYQYLHKQIVIWLVYFCVKMINAVPAAKGISDQFAPRKIVTGQRLNLKHIKAGFGDYIETPSCHNLTWCESITYTICRRNSIDHRYIKLDKPYDNLFMEILIGITPYQSHI